MQLFSGPMQPEVGYRFGSSRPYHGQDTVFTSILVRIWGQFWLLGYCEKLGELISNGAGNRLKATTDKCHSNYDSISCIARPKAISGSSESNSFKTLSETILIQYFKVEIGNLFNGWISRLYFLSVVLLRSCKLTRDLIGDLNSTYAFCCCNLICSQLARSLSILPQISLIILHFYSSGHGKLTVEVIMIPSTVRHLKQFFAFRQKIWNCSFSVTLSLSHLAWMCFLRWIDSISLAIWLCVFTSAVCSLCRFLSLSVENPASDHLISNTGYTVRLNRGIVHCPFAYDHCLVHDWTTSSKSGW